MSFFSGLDLFPRTRAIACYLFALISLAAVFALLGFPDPWGLALTWVNTVVLTLGAIGFAALAIALITGGLK